MIEVTCKIRLAAHKCGSDIAGAVVGEHPKELLSGLLGA